MWKNCVGISPPPSGIALSGVGRDTFHSFIAIFLPIFSAAIIAGQETTLRKLDYAKQFFRQLPWARSFDYFGHTRLLYLRVKWSRA
jgi:hypothetical protein